MARFVVISPMVPSFSHMGNTARVASLMAYLRRKGHHLTLVLAQHRPRPSRFAPGLDAYADRLRPVPLAGRPIPGVGRGPLFESCRPHRSWVQRGLGTVASRLWPVTPVQEEIAAVVEDENADCVWVVCQYMAPLIDRVPPRAGRFRVCDTHDCLHQRDESLRREGLKAHYGLSRMEEADYLGRFDLVLAIQESEAAEFRAMQTAVSMAAAAPTVITAPYGMEAASFSPSPAESRSVLFVGSKNPPNIHGITRYIHETWPKVLDRVPDAQLWIVGQAGKDDGLRRAARSAGPSVFVWGHVAELDTLYRQAAMVVCPLWAGSGLKIKLVEALARGKAVASTPVAGQGLEGAMGIAFWCGRDTAELANHTSELLADLNVRRALERAARQCFEQQFAAAAAYAELDRWLAARLAGDPLRGRSAA
jgi:glycosyltransferase involved in cell wall biosynthesis